MSSSPWDFDLDERPSTSCTLYHYCSSETFFKIVTGSSVRLSALSLSNDSMEGRWTQKIFSDVCRDTIQPNATLEIFEKASIELPEVYGALGLCLSEKPDSLSQWRGYADDGHGFCVGFDRSRLEKLSDAFLVGQQSCVLTKVVYVEEEQRRLMRQIVNQLRDLLMREISAYRQSGRTDIEVFNNELNEFAFERLDKKLAPYLFAMKNPAFDEEQEWRCVATYLVGNRALDLCYHPSRNKLSPFVTLPFGIGPSPISEVYIGPKHATPKSLVEDFLQRFAPDATVNLSTATYR